MAFPAVAAYNDKGAGLFTQSGCVELNADFFDEFLNYDNECINISQSISSENTSLDSQSRVSSISTIDEEGVQNGSWYGNGEPWGNGTNPASLHSAQGNQFYAELSGRAAISDSELLSLEGISLESPCIINPPQSSLPSSPLPSAATTLRRKSRVVESLSQSYRRGERKASIGDGSLRSPIRKSISTPKMLRTPSQNFEAWGQLDGSKFNFEQDFVPLSPPASVTAPYANQTTQFVPPVKQQRPLNGFSSNSVYTAPAQLHRSQSYSTPIATPQLEHPMSRASNSSLQADVARFPATPHSQDISGQWSQLPATPDFTQTKFPIETAISEEAMCWNHAASAPMAQPTPSNFHTSPHHQRITKSTAMQLQNNLGYTQNRDEQLFDPVGMAHGLMIQLPPHNNEQNGRLARQTSQDFLGDRQPAYYGTPRGLGSQPPQQQQQTHHSMDRKAGRQELRHQSLPQLPQLPHQHQLPLSQHPGTVTGASATTTTIITAASMNPDLEDSISPTSTAFQVRRRKGPSNKKSNAALRGASAGGMSAFVNYTPDDSKKILTGVAPSGSSKTKARREKEALDRRRKLSQAAVRAVRDAGGDVSSLEMALIA